MNMILEDLKKREEKSLWWVQVINSFRKLVSFTLKNEYWMYAKIFYQFYLNSLVLGF